MRTNHEPPQPRDLAEQLNVVEALIVELRVAHTTRHGIDKGSIADPQVRQRIDCLEATRRILLWANRCDHFVRMGNHLLPAQRNELKGLEAAVLEFGSETGEAVTTAMNALIEREREYGVYDEVTHRPHWQD